MDAGNINLGLNEKPNVVNTTKRSGVNIIAGILVALVFITGIYLFLTLNIFSSLRNRLFFQANLIYSPVNLDNARIIRVGTSYIFTGKITDIKSVNKVITITTDIPDLPPVEINQAVQIYQGPTINASWGISKT